MCRFDFLVSNDECERVLDQVSELLPENVRMRYRLILEEVFSVITETHSGITAHMKVYEETPRLVLRLAGDEVGLFRQIKWDSGSDEDVRSQIRFKILMDNADRIVHRYNAKKRLNTFIVKEPSSSKTNEQKIDEFFSSGEKITPLKQIFFFRRLYYFKFMLSLVATIMKISPQIVIPIITAKLIDMLIANESNVVMILVMIGIGLLSLLLNVIGAHFEGTIFKRLIHSIEADLRSAMVRKLQRLSLSYHKNTQSGLIISKIMMDVDRISFIQNIFFGDVFQVVAYIVVAAVMTLLQCKWMALFYFLSLPIAISVHVAFRDPIAKRNNEYRKDQEKANAAIGEMLDMIDLSRAHGLQNNENSRVDRYLRRIRRSGTSLDTVNSLFNSLSYASLQVFQLICLMFSALMAHGGLISVGSIALFQSYFVTLLSKATTMVNHMPEFNRAIESCKSVAEILCTDEIEHSGAIKVNHGMKGSIEFKNVSFRYKDSPKMVLRDFSLSIPEKKSIAIVGSSGSGKSTILNLIIGGLEPCSGQITIDGIDLKDIDLTTYRHQIAVVPQVSMLYTGTVYDNLTYGISYVSRSMVESMVEAVDLKGFVDSLPNGLDTVIEEGGANLSRGQGQKISLARALLRRPRILILDEFTNALDRRSENNVLECVQRILGTCTVLIVSHKPEAVKMVDEIVVIGDGTVAEKGSYRKLSSGHGPFHDIFIRK